MVRQSAQTQFKPRSVDHGEKTDTNTIWYTHFASNITHLYHLQCVFSVVITIRQLIFKIASALAYSLLMLINYHNNFEASH